MSNEAKAPETCEFEDLSIDLMAKIEAIFISLSSSNAEPHVETMALIGLDIASKLGCAQDEFFKTFESAEQK